MSQNHGNYFSEMLRTINASFHEIQATPSMLHWVCRQFCNALAVICVIAAVCGQVAGGNRLVEVRDKENAWSGKLIAMNKSTCVLFDRMGEMHRLPIASLTSFQRVADQYQPFSISEFRARLLKEFPRGYQLSGTSHYLVCGPTGKSETYAKLFEDVYRSVDSYYRVRRFQISPPDTPLVAIIFGTQTEFAEYCRADKVTWSSGLRGYYSLKTNRIAMYDDPVLVTQLENSAQHWFVADAGLREACQQLAVFSLSGDTAGTIIHETTHQVSYNIGIHSRAAVTPTWVCEGLATLLEAPGIRKSTGSRSQQSRTNSERLNWFRYRYSARRKRGDLARLISSDDFFRRQSLDGYSAAWAFTFFLAENPTYTRKFTSYLKTVSERDPMSGYSARERLSDFTSSFGDIAKVEVDFLRFMDRL
jgi:Protein of unknown function (DUF1570)